MSSRPQSKRGARNKVMGVLALLAAGLLLSAATGTYRAFSYLAAFFIAAVLGTASVERNDGELDLAPYSWLVVGLGAVFVTGLTIIWFTWRPGTTEYTYVLGLPVPTLAYVVFLWLLPILGAVYYALVFPSIGDEQVVDDIMSEVRQVQGTGRYPLSSRPEADGGEEAETPRASSGRRSDGTEGGPRVNESRQETERPDGGERR
ncbi:hypothetical protein [Halomicrococcus sp. NG-SE-24]|uniref:hypothetical protein n=1 Tax=Halomicrococcus sp. NG-SE-24 TaxID=3436928 RepID=UPI003D95F65E